MRRFYRYARRSLAGPLLFLAAGFIAVPVAIYLTFQQAEHDRQALLIRTAHAQGLIVANSIAPILSTGGDRKAFDEAATDLARFAIGQARVRPVFRPAKLTGSSVTWSGHVALLTSPVFMSRERLSMFSAAHQRTPSQLLPAGHGTQPGG